jgi:predicted nucleic acid-binding Zn finger protein
MYVEGSGFFGNERSQSEIGHYRTAFSVLLEKNISTIAEAGLCSCRKLVAYVLKQGNRSEGEF